MKLDHFGNPFVPEKNELKPYQVDSSTADLIYLRYSDKTPCAIHRYTTVDGVTTCEWAYGSWSSRSTLSYQPLNKPCETTD